MQGLITSLWGRRATPSIRTCLRLEAALLQQRWAGGGGRPGGRPALNWKEKRSLGLDKLQKKKVFRIRPDGYGDPETDLYPFMKPERGDKLIDITDMAEFTLPALEEDEDEEAVDPEDNPRKKIQLSMLYGPTKSAGLMLKKENRDKKRFSHRRIFGEGMDDETWKKISAEKAKKYADCFTRRRRASAQAKNRLWSGVYGM